MQFIDDVKIYVKSGAGGNGCISFRREANVPMGGPDGGDGGRGAHVIVRAVHGLNTLIDFRYQQHFKAERGHGGMGKNRYGRKGKDLIVKVPVGTQIFDDDEQFMFVDLCKEGQEYILCKGGDGGLGNTHYKSSANQAPRKMKPGGPSEEMWVRLKLKLLSDVGLVGLPNAGKSTFLNRVTRAKPKIADYPFTTLKPQLGVAYVDHQEFVIADIPGLIEGAHEGTGLGIRFLKHIERCGAILHIIDGCENCVVAPYKTIRYELEQYSQNLAQKDEIVVINKSDSIPQEILDDHVNQLRQLGVKTIYAMSAVAGDGVDGVLRSCLEKMKQKALLEEL